MIYFLFPVYNEEKNLRELIDNISRSAEQFGQDYKIIFVNDGSTDKSLDIMNDSAKNNPGILILSHYPNLGVMKTFTEGFRKFIEIGTTGDILITQEADNTSCNEILVRMIKSVLESKYDLALASCYHPEGKVINTTFTRKLLSYTANMFVKARFNLWGFNTFSSFYRVYSYECLRNLFRSCPDPMTVNGYCCVVELLVRLVRRGARIIEIPMVLDTSKRKGRSKMKIMKTILAYFKLFCVKI